MSAGDLDGGASPGDWAGWIDGRLDDIRAARRWRSPREFDAWGPRGTLAGTGAAVVSFASNDYLGLTVHPTVLAAAHAALERWGTGSGSARLITGSRPVHASLERELAAWKRTDRAVLFPTGFAANLAVLSTLGHAGACIVSDERNHASVEVVRVGTLSKALGALGGFAACSDRVADLLVNAARPGIFTTALPPADAAAALAAVQVVRGADGANLRARLRAHVDRLRPGHPSPIVSIVLGDEDRALDASARLLERGILVPAIRPPTVAPGTSRLRVTMSAAHSDGEVSRLLRALLHVVGPDAVPAAGLSADRGPAPHRRPVSHR